MAKIRVFQIASEINFDKNKLVAICKQNGIDVKSPLSSVDEDLAGQIKAQLNWKRMTLPQLMVYLLLRIFFISSDDLEKGKVPIADKESEKVDSETGSRPGQNLLKKINKKLVQLKVRLSRVNIA